jgi:hypothetical protein
LYLKKINKMKIIFNNFCLVLFVILFVFSVNTEELKGANS